MTPDEVVEYLGFLPGTQIVKEVIDGMADVPKPHDDVSQMAAYRAFLRCAPALRQARRTRTQEPWPMVLGSGGQPEAPEGRQVE